MQQTVVVPYLRSSPLYDARRDLVAHSAESLWLRVTVIERDDPSAQLLLLTGGLGGPAAHLSIWADYDHGCRSCDYGRPPVRGHTLWAGWGEPQTGLGSFDWHVPAGTLYSLPPRCGWAVQLAWDGGTKVDTLMQGIMHIGGVIGPVVSPESGLVLATSDSIPIWTSDNSYITT